MKEFLDLIKDFQNLGMLGLVIVFGGGLLYAAKYIIEKQGKILEMYIATQNLKNEELQRKNEALEKELREFKELYNNRFNELHRSYENFKQYEDIINIAIKQLFILTDKTPKP